jgi:hypothetical protein
MDYADVFSEIGPALVALPSALKQPVRDVAKRAVMDNLLRALFGIGVARDTTIDPDLGRPRWMAIIVTRALKILKLKNLASYLSRLPPEWRETRDLPGGRAGNVFRKCPGLRRMRGEWAILGAPVVEDWLEEESRFFFFNSVYETGWGGRRVRRRGR